MKLQDVLKSTVEMALYGCQAGVFKPGIRKVRCEKLKNKRQTVIDSDLICV
jgi:hypothetical protein